MKAALVIIIPSFFLAACKPPAAESNKEAVAVKGNCSYTRNELNPEGKPIKMLEEAMFISLTNADTAAARRTGNSDYMKGYLSCISIDTVLGVYFNFKIFSADAYREYGMIRKDNKISFILKSGKTVIVPFLVTFSGNTNLTAELTEYKTYAHISGEEAELLKSSDLERVTISWAKMQEDYKVVNPGVFMTQLPCVE